MLKRHELSKVKQKSSLVSGNRVKIVLSYTHPHGRMCIRMCTRIRKKPKKLKKEKLVTRISGKNSFFVLFFFVLTKKRMAYIQDLQMRSR